MRRAHYHPERTLTLGMWITGELTINPILVLTPKDIMDLCIFLRGYDIAMKTFSNGKERTSDDFHTLFSTVDNRFEISSIRRPPGSAMSIIEVVWKG